MKRCSFNEFKSKEVINISDGKRLGCVEDIEFDLECGQILALVIPEKQGMLSFSKDKEYVIGWQKIQRVGSDFIIVDIGCDTECCEGDPNPPPKPPKRRFFC